MNDSQRKGIHQRDPRMSKAEEVLVRSLVRLAITEDVGPGDVTTRAVIPETLPARGRVFAKEAGVLSGLEAARAAVLAVDETIDFRPKVADGAPLAIGDVVLEIEGDARSILTVERVMLNFMQRLSGIATLTRKYVDLVAETMVEIVDTRKTTPGLRFLEKTAVLHGGGANHRMGLYDAFMIKDNHIIAAGGITQAVERVRASGPVLHLVLEVRTAEEVAEGAALGVDQLLLDNMDPEEISRSIESIRWIEAEKRLGRAWIEVSGGVDLDSVRAKALAGPDLISIGALTHSAPALDLSLDLDLQVES